MNTINFRSVLCVYIWVVMEMRKILFRSVSNLWKMLFTLSMFTLIYGRNLCLIRTNINIYVFPACELYSDKKALQYSLLHITGLTHIDDCSQSIVFVIHVTFNLFIKQLQRIRLVGTNTRWANQKHDLPDAKASANQTTARDRYLIYFIKISICFCYNSDYVSNTKNYILTVSFGETI